MKKLMLSLCLCASVVGSVFAADQAVKSDAVAQLNKIYADGKTKYAALTKEIEKLKTGNRLNAKTEIATAEKKQQEIVEKIKAVKTDDNLAAQQRQAIIIAELKKGRELTGREAETIMHNLAHVEYVKNMKK